MPLALHPINTITASASEKLGVGPTCGTAPKIAHPAAISSTDIRVSDDRRTWRSVWTFPDVDVYGCAFCGIEWDGTHFVTTGTVAWERCSGGGRCPLHHWLTSTDGRIWTALDGPDGEPGPDRDFLVTTASLSDRTVALGWSADGDPVVWLAEEPPEDA